MIVGSSGGSNLSSAATHTLGADADTAIWFNTNEGNNYGNTDHMYLRQRDHNSGSKRDFIGYLRFDLSSLGAITIGSATLTLTKVDASRNDNLVTERFALYGLEDDAGNTSQTWNETSLTWNNSGSETDESIYPIPAAGESPLDLTLVTDLDGDVAGMTEAIVSGDSDGGTVIFSGAPLVAFLQSRVDAGSGAGLATFIVDFPAFGGSSTSNRGYGLGTKELSTSGYRPELVIMTTNAECGNGSIEPGEPCDDGGTSPGDCYSATCQIEVGDPMCSGPTPPTVTETGSDITVDNAARPRTSGFTTTASSSPDRIFSSSS